MSATPVKAKRYAELCHAGQRYADEAPYSVHLEAVVAVLYRFGVYKDTMVCAAWLHDAIEDTETSYNDIHKRFGTEVAELVYAVTSELGRNRRERNEKTYPKLAQAGQDAMCLKLADRIANVEYGMATGGKNDMYAKEFQGFQSALRYQYALPDEDVEKVPSIEPVYPDLEPMWNYLARLLNPPPLVDLIKVARIVCSCGRGAYACICPVLP